jgi:hypothetical protein
VKIKKKKVYGKKRTKGKNHGVPEVERLHKERNKNSTRRRTIVTYKRETSGNRESWKKQDDMTTLGGIKGRKGSMGHHIKRTNWRWQGRVMESTKPLEMH